MNAPRRTAPVAIASVLICIAAATALAQEPKTPRATGEAPPNQVIVGSKLGGSFFVPKPLKERYDALVGKVKVLEQEIAEGRISGKEAIFEVTKLRAELRRARQQIDQQKKFIPAGKQHTKSDSIAFKLGPERRLLILAGKVRIVGWDQSEVKCVLDKTVLTPGDEPVDEHFEQMQVAHEHRSAENEVGKTAEELEAEEVRYLESDAGKKLDAKGREWRRRFLDQNIAWRQIYRPLQGHTIDVISLKGLSHAEGNRQITLEVGSKDGERSMSSHWQRHAALTVYVPACEVVAVQGGLGGLDIESVQASVIVRGDGDRDYHGQFRVRGLKGSLAVDGVPVQLIDDVTGHAEVTMTAYLGNSGTRHADDTRTSYVFPPEEYSYDNIAGGFRGRFVRANLDLFGIGGPIDVENEYGKTTLTIYNPLPKAAHRVVTHGGQIELLTTKNAFADLPVLAVSECGTVRLGYEDGLFQNVNWTSATPDGELRGWRGFERKTPADQRDSFFERSERIPAALAGEDRSEGLDLVSRGGSIQILRAK